MATSRRRGQGGDPTAAPVLAEVYDPLFAATASLEKALGLNRTSNAMLRIPILRLAGIMQEAIRVQKTSLQFNRTLSQSISKLDGTMEGVPGGLLTSLQTLFAFEQQGLTEVSKASLTLANRMQITGQNVAGLVKLNKTALVQGLFNNKQLTALNQGTLDLAVQFGVSTDLLVNSMEGLSKSIGILGLTGAAPETLKAVRDLTAQFPHLGGAIGDFVNAMVKGDIGNLARLGILDDVNKLVSGGMNANQLVALVEKTTAGANRFGGFRGAGIIEARVLEQLAGPGGVLANQITEGMKNIPALTASEETDKIMADFITTIKTEFLPLIRVVAMLSTKLLEFAGVVAKIPGVVQAFTTGILAKLVFSIGLQIKATYDLIKVQLMASKLGVARDSIAPARLIPAKAAFTGGAFKAMFRSMAMAIGPAGLVALGIGAGLTFLIGRLAKSQEKLAEAEFERSKAKLRELDDARTGKSKFEEVTKVLFNSAMLHIGAAKASHVSNAEEIGKLTGAVVMFNGIMEDAVASRSLPELRTVT